MNLTPQDVDGSLFTPKVTRIHWMEVQGENPYFDVVDPNHVTVALTGVCVYDADWSSTLYPWHRIKKVERIR